MECSEPKQVEVGASVGLAFEHLESVHLAFGLPLTMRGEQRRGDGIVIAPNAVDEAHEFGNPAMRGSLQPGV